MDSLGLMAMISSICPFSKLQKPQIMFLNLVLIGHLWINAVLHEGLNSFGQSASSTVLCTLHNSGVGSLRTRPLPYAELDSQGCSFNRSIDTLLDEHTMISMLGTNHSYYTGDLHGTKFQQLVPHTGGGPLPIILAVSGPLEQHWMDFLLDFLRPKYAGDTGWNNSVSVTPTNEFQHRAVANVTELELQFHDIQEYFNIHVFFAGLFCWVAPVSQYVFMDACSAGCSLGLGSYRLEQSTACCTFDIMWRFSLCGGGLLDSSSSGP